MENPRIKQIQIQPAEDLSVSITYAEKRDVLTNAKIEETENLPVVGWLPDEYVDEHDGVGLLVFFNGRVMLLSEVDEIVTRPHTIKIISWQ